MPPTFLNWSVGGWPAEAFPLPTSLRVLCSSGSWLYQMDFLLILVKCLSQQISFYWPAIWDWFHGLITGAKPYIIKAKCWNEWWKACCHWTSKQWKYVLQVDLSDLLCLHLEIHQTSLGLAFARRPALVWFLCIKFKDCQQAWKQPGAVFRNWTWGLRSLVHHANIFWAMYPALRELFGNGLFMFQLNCEPLYKARSIKRCTSGFGEEELALYNISVSQVCFWKDC